MLPSFHNPQTHRARTADILTLAARLSGIPESRIRSRCRKRPTSRVRAAVCLIAGEHGHSNPVIGAVLGIDHSSVIYARRRAPILAMYEHGYARFIRSLRAKALTVRPFMLDLEEIKPIYTYVGVPTAKQNGIKPKNHFANDDNAFTQEKKSEARALTGSDALLAAIMEERG